MDVPEVDEASPLGLVLRRLSQALDAAETRAERRFGADLVGVLPDLRRFALSVTRDAVESEDLVQFTLLKAWEHRTSFKPGTSLKAWLFTIMRNGHVNCRRKYRREVPDPEGSYAAGLACLADQEHRLDVRDVQEALDRLEPSQREALLLVAVEDLTYEAAAMLIGCPAGTVKSRVSRARDRLAADLGIG
ncbi:sigma-70 family RNA polymerase sigma factor [Methylobacterium aerolatum]|uniref:RNA polymerase sigma factor n=1 Tax=Methylobacterium aerolatum TaxID=418708 RepID=A0ABU0I356_9HYPH|nr:sigma-70 family RNA polymerase sigma factor [Methylobacterium aerolatum]MDQ0448109.1 RNA polymerase sigma-70 factor (ECF subfamily) [Methylobacterium aerolatum]